MAAGPVPGIDEGSQVTMVATESAPTIEESAEVTAVKVRRHYAKLVAEGVAAAPAPEPVDATPATELAAVPMPVPGGPAPAPAPESLSSFNVGSGGFGLAEGKPAVDVKMNAEVVLSGRAQPGQTIQLNGRWIQVNADGTFSVRLALPLAKD